MGLQLGIPRRYKRQDEAQPRAALVPDSPYDVNFQMVEVVRNVNKFDSSIKHKPNVFSVVVENSNLAQDKSVDMSQDTPESKMEKYKEQLRNNVTQFVRNACEDIAPAHTQLVKVQFT